MEGRKNIQQLTAELQSSEQVEVRVKELEGPEESAEQAEPVAAPDCFSNPVVMKKILECFSNPQLLEISTICKFWKEQARLLMRKRGNVIARLECSEIRPSQDVFQSFGEDLGGMNIVPYSGMTIVIHPESHAEGTGVAATLDPTREAILERVPLRHLSLKLVQRWRQSQDCSTFLLLKKLMEDFSGIIESLSLDIEEDIEVFIENLLPDSSLPCLKLLELKAHGKTSDAKYPGNVKMLVSRAPNLQELHTDGLTLRENLLEGTRAVHVLDCVRFASYGSISESVIGALRLKRLLMHYTGPEFDLDRFNRIAPIMMEACCAATLQVLEISAALVVPLMCYGIRLENVKLLKILMDYHRLEQFEPRFLNIIKALDFTSIFPNLAYVEIFDLFFNEPSPDHMNTIIEQAEVEAVMRRPRPDRVANIKEFHLHQAQGSISTAVVQFFSEMFPAIHKLVMGGAEEIPFGAIWEHWVDLEEIDATGTIVHNTGNLDSVFCGIFPAEVEELRQKDEGYLKSVHIVPVMPAITCLKNLETLTLSNLAYGAQPFIDDGTYVFSKVTGFVAFARRPSLGVHIKLSCFQDGYSLVPMSHLTDFASVELVHRRDV